MLDEEEGSFVCIFIDEIESLASTRQHSVNSKEPQDTLRVSAQTLSRMESMTTDSSEQGG